MSRSKQFSVLNSIPKGLQHRAGQMHPETKRIIDQVKRTRGKVLACSLKTTREASNRMDALRRARARGRVAYKEARRSGNTLYIRLR